MAVAIIVLGIFIFVGETLTRLSIRIEANVNNIFSKTLGLNYQPRGDVPSQGKVFSKGYPGIVSNVFSGVISENTFRFFDYFYRTRSGRMRTETILMVGEVNISNEFPRVIGIPRIWEEIFFSVYRWRPKDFKELSVEGELGKNFILYIPSDIVVNDIAYQKLLKLLNLIQTIGNSGFECIDSKAYLFTGGKMGKNPSKISSVYNNVLTFGEILNS
ncbi:MAG: hypothetical protein ABIT47_03980 [Candidatus Paceibacterota bacterium]